MSRKTKQSPPMSSYRQSEYLRKKRRQEEEPWTLPPIGPRPPSTPLGVPILRSGYRETSSGSSGYRPTTSSSQGTNDSYRPRGVAGYALPPENWPHSYPPPRTWIARPSDPKGGHYVYHDKRQSGIPQRSLAAISTSSGGVSKAQKMKEMFDEQQRRDGRKVITKKKSWFSW